MGHLFQVLSIWNLTIFGSSDHQSSINEDGIGEMEGSGHTVYFFEVDKAHFGWYTLRFTEKGNITN